ncbi:hypothetical protein RMSM_00628 [Rhodopirellula maiorica SM1]|uniref:Uncharacterized protein n=1 Tax=Rhodopirellula maiorica SM1 TaxID=1265738 RepID=M5S8E8_9BACT|nr:hypothetical protein RMSM_00628 [Rhodopirellula maiorica SM1]
MVNRVVGTTMPQHKTACDLYRRPFFYSVNSGGLIVAWTLERP